MMRLDLLGLAGTLAFCMVLSFGPSKRLLAGHSEHQEKEERSEILVCFTEQALEKEIHQLEAQYALTRISEFAHLHACHYELPAESNGEAMLAALNIDALVRFAEPDYSRTLQASLDPWFSAQWGLKNTGQRANGVTGTAGIDIAWSSAMNLYSGTEPVVVAVIDSGVALDHPEFLTLNPEFITSLALNLDEVLGNVNIDDDFNGYLDDFFGWDFFDGDNEPLDEHGHGSLVASIIGGIGSNGEGGEGIAPHAAILPIRVLNDFNRGSVVSDFVAASTYAQRLGAKIINCSFGGREFSALEQLQVGWLGERGVLLVCAAGNGGEDLRGDNTDIQPFYPSSYDGEHVISVAAVDQHGRLAPFSNFGVRTVDLAAPGVDIFGADVSRSRVFFEDFEGFTSGWTTGELAGNESTDDWLLWEDQSLNTWLTDGTFDALLSPTNYAPNTNTYAEGPRIDLRNVEGPQLAVDVYYDLPGELGSLSSIDLLLIEASTDRIVWDVVGIAYDRADPSEPRRVAFDLSPYEDQFFYLRFRLVTDERLQGDGVYIDDVEVTQVDLFQYDGTQYGFGDGTSFAAPMVSGVAAMIWSQRPDLTVAQVRQAILEGVTPLQTLSGRVASGGMLNSRRALEIAIAFPSDATGLFADAEDLGQGWKFLDWFGAWNDTIFPWIFHTEHGWLFVGEGSEDDELWIYDLTLGWLFTSDTSYPTLFSHSRKSWVFYFKNTNPRAFVDLASNESFVAI